MSIKSIAHERAVRAFRSLVDGNKRFQQGLRSVEPLLSTQKMKELAERGQSPHAIILTCSDSRVPAELVFDQGLGDLFVIRVAGNVLTPSIIASVEYAATVLKSPLCVVMGHSGCGAVAAAVDAEVKGTDLPSSSLRTLISKIRPAVRSAIEKLGGHHAHGHAHPELLKEATIENVDYALKQLRRKSPLVRTLESKQDLLLAGALYDIKTGRVEFKMSEEEKTAKLLTDVLPLLASTLKPSTGI